MAACRKLLACHDGTPTWMSDTLDRMADPAPVRLLPASPACSAAAASSWIMSFTLAVMAVRTASTLPSRAVIAALLGPRAAGQGRRPRQQAQGGSATLRCSL